MLNWIFIALVAGAVVTGAFNGTLPKVTEASLSSAKGAVDLAIGLIGQMALWLGLMGVLREGGLLRSIARALSPVMRRLFPDVPPDHPAMGAMVMNVAANVLGLGNAATPFGLKAMAELNRLNRHPGTATNAMALFLAINTSGVAVLPLGAVAIRAALGSHDAAGIIVPSILATSLNTVAAVLVAKGLERLPAFAPPASMAQVAPPPEPVVAPPVAADAAMREAEAAAAPVEPARGVRRWVAWGLAGAVAFAAVRYAIRASATTPGLDVARALFSDWLLPVLMLSVVLFGFARRVKVYEVF
ncbi:MAG TPA: nucleoside recognition domain-containing protein, partial [Myxococcaceae bacterium]|nr:nucleoside recognition domain-containing protein [Myxococcaceae bacterium]